MTTPVTMTMAEYRALGTTGQPVPATRKRTTQRALPAAEGCPMRCQCGTPIAGTAAWLRHEAEAAHHRLECVDPAIVSVQVPHVAQDAVYGPERLDTHDRVPKRSTANGENDSQ